MGSLNEVLSGARGHRIGVLCKGLDALADSFQLRASRAGIVSANVAACAPQIAFSLGRDDDAVAHVRASGLAFQVIENFVHGTALSLLGLRQTTADAGHGVQMIGYVPICCRIEHNDFGLPLTVRTSGLPVFFMRFINPDELRLNVVME